ncbi:ubiquitin, partial [Aspergillus sp. HF37]
QDPGQGRDPARPAAPDLCRQAAGGRPHALGLQHPEGIDAPSRAPAPRRYANLRKDTYWQDDYAGGGELRHDRQRQVEDPGQGGHSSGPAAADFRGQAVGGRADSQRLQHPEGEHVAL